MIVLDASVLIGHLAEDDALHALARTTLSELDGEALAVSVVTLAEVLVGPAQRGVVAAATSALRRLEIETLDLAAADAEEVALVRAETKLKLPDCCVLLAAERHQAGLATFDVRLAAVARERGVRVIPGG